MPTPSGAVQLSSNLKQFRRPLWFAISLTTHCLPEREVRQKCSPVEEEVASAQTETHDSTRRFIVGLRRYRRSRANEGQTSSAASRGKNQSSYPQKKIGNLLIIFH